MGGVLAGVLPQALGGVEFGRVGWKLVNFQPVPVGTEPTPDLRVLMVGGVVLNQDGPAASIGEGQLLQEVEVGGSIEDRGLCIVETGLPEFDGAEDLDVLALSRDGKFRGMADATPSGVECGILSEAGFVGENQRPLLGAGFFLRRG